MKQNLKPATDVMADAALGRKLMEYAETVLRLGSENGQLQNLSTHLAEENKRLTADNEALRKAMGDKAPAPPAPPADPPALNAAETKE